MYKFKSWTENRSLSRTCKQCNEHFQKNSAHARCHLLKSNSFGVAVCENNTDSQRRLLPGLRCLDPRACGHPIKTKVACVFLYHMCRMFSLPLLLSHCISQLDQTVTHRLLAVTDKYTATHFTIRSRKCKTQNNIYIIYIISTFTCVI